MRYKSFKMEDALESLIDYRGKTPQKSDNGIMTLSAKSVRDGYIDYSQCYYISKDEYKRYMVRGFPRVGDVLMTTEAPLGVTARLDRDDIALAQRLLTLRGNPEVLDTGYLYYYLRSPKGQAKLRERQTGTTVTGIKQSEFRKIEIELPDIKSQRKIASALETIDEKIRCNKTINENLLQQALCLFEEDFVTQADIDEDLSIYDFAEYINGAAFKPDELGDAGLPVIKIAELKAGITGSTRFFSGNKDPKYLVHNKDILFSWSGNPETSIDLFVWSEGDGILNQHTFNVKSKYGCPWFTFLMLKYHKTTFMHIASNKQTTGLGHVTAADLKRLTFPFSIERMNAFEVTVAPIMDLFYSNLLENRMLSSLRDTLLPRLMLGELDVSDIDL